MKQLRQRSGQASLAVSRKDGIAALFLFYAVTAERICFVVVSPAPAALSGRMTYFDGNPLRRTGFVSIRHAVRKG